MDRNLQFRAPSPLEALHWIFCFFSSIYVQFRKTNPPNSGESSEKSSGENRVKSCHVCGCHVFFGPDFVSVRNIYRTFFTGRGRLGNICRNLGNRQGTTIDTQEQQMHTELQDWLRSESLTVKDYAAPIGAFFCLEIRAFTGLGARFLQPFSRSLVTVKYYSNTKTSH